MEGNTLRRIAAIALVLVLTGCAAKVGGRANYRELTVGSSWANAQYWLSEHTGGHSYNVPYGIFKWKFLDNAIHLKQADGSVDFVLGYFDPIEMEILITLPFVPTHVIEHEACHAILFTLGDSEWVTYCHEPERPWFDLRGD